MKIENIELVNVLIPQAEPNLPRSVGRNYGAYMLVRVKCDNGLEGLSEGYCGNATTAVVALIHDMLAPEIIGQDPMNANGLWERMYRAGFYSGRVGVNTLAISTLELALWDIIGKRSGVPLYSLLGGSVRKMAAPHNTLRFLFGDVDDKKVPVYASLQPYRKTEEAVVAAVEAVRAGHKSVKLHQVDLESVRATRQALGDDVEITIDPTGFYNPVGAERFAKSLAEYNVGWLEEPIWPPDDYQALARLRNRSPVPIAGGENECTIWGFERIFEAEAVDILQPEIMRLGGLMQSFKVCSMAQSRNIPLAPHNFRFGPVLAGIGHLSLLFPNVISVETPWFQSEANLLKEGPEVSNGNIRMNDKPGLGVVLDEDVVKEYRIDKFPRK